VQDGAARHTPFEGLIEKFVLALYKLSCVACGASIDQAGTLEMMKVEMMKVEMMKVEMMKKEQTNLLNVTARPWLGCISHSSPRHHHWLSRMLVIALVMSLWAGLTPTAVTAQSDPLVALSNIGGSVFYTAPGEDNVMTFASGQPLTATARTADSRWVAVHSADGITGWVLAEQLIIFGIERLPVSGESMDRENVGSENIDSESVDSENVDSENIDSESVDSESIDSESVLDDVITHNASAIALNATVSLRSGRLNVRAEPGTTAMIIGKAYPGNEVLVAGRDASGDWVQIQWPVAVADSNVTSNVTSSVINNGAQLAWVAARYVTVAEDVEGLPIVTTGNDAPIYQETAIEPATNLETTSAPTAATTTTVAASTVVATASSGSTGLSGTLVIQSSPGGLIYGYNLATHTLWSLTNGFDPAISPDGQTVAFVREGGENGLYLINIDGSNERLIFSGRSRLSAPKWSPDGTWILFTRSDEYSACLEAGRGGCVSVDALPPGTATADLVVSKDYEYNLAAVDSNGSNYHDIAALESARVADWNAAGIVYQSSAGLQLTADSANAENQLLLFTPLQPPYEDPDWQPNGGQVLFVQHHGSHYEIFRIGVDGSGMSALTRPVTTLVDEMPNNVAPAWSPDGQHIVFLSNREENHEAGRWRVWIMNADGSNQQALPIDITINYTYGNEQIVDWGP